MKNYRFQTMAFCSFPNYVMYHLSILFLSTSCTYNSWSFFFLHHLWTRLFSML